MNARTLLAATLAAALGACNGPLDEPSSVHDLRILAIRAEPAEILVDPAQPVPPVFDVQALVLDPAGAGRTLKYEFLACPRATDLRCDVEPDAVVIGSGEVSENVAQVRFAPTLEFLEATQKRDPYKGAFGLQPIVMLRVTAEGEEVLGGKRLVLGLKQPGVEANRNPGEPRVLLGGAPLADGHAVRPGDRIELDVERVEGDREDYVVRSFEGETIALTETFRFSWFTTQGRFELNRTGGADVAREEEQASKNTLVVPSNATAGPLFVYVVVRDGRGGETWTRRRLEIASVP